jgi:hypothetical protein
MYLAENNLLKNHCSRHWNRLKSHLNILHHPADLGHCKMKKEPRERRRTGWVQSWNQMNILLVLVAQNFD